MKLATYRDGSRDGQLVVVSRDLTQAHYASGIATRLQQVLDDWNFMSPQLESLSQALQQGRARHAFAFDPAQCMAPLPRAGHRAGVPGWLGALAPHGGHDASDTALALLQAPGDDLSGPQDDVAAAAEDDGLDFGAGLGVLTGDVPQASPREAALEGVRLFMLVNEWSLASRVAEALSTGIGWLACWPALACAPVAVTPDELGAGWRGGQVHLTLECQVNGRRFGLCDAAGGPGADFGALLAALAAPRRLRAGSLVARGVAGAADGLRGHGSIAEKRAFEGRADGSAKTAFLRTGDVVRLELKGADGASVFGAITQRVTGQATQRVNGDATQRVSGGPSRRGTGDAAQRGSDPEPEGAAAAAPPRQTASRARRPSDAGSTPAVDGATQGASEPPVPTVDEAHPPQSAERG